MTPPRQLWRVEYVQGLGMPDVYKREQTSRTYADADGAGRMVATIRSRPDHHTLIGVWCATPAWTPVDPDSLPIPTDEGADA